jgi:Na+/proline symporter
MWGFLMAAFFMSYMGKWVRRSNVMTGAEWMVTRFGDRADGRTARIAYTIMAVVTLTGLIGYAFQGIGKFASVYIDLGLEPVAEANTLAVIIFTATTLYVLLGGLYGVVVTNVIQTVVLTIASIMIAGVAYFEIAPHTLQEVLPSDWTSLMPVWRIEGELPKDYASYHLFGALVIVWVLKGLLLNFGGPGQMTDFQAILAARNPRDASKLGAAWSGFLVVRWAMCMGIALLAITGITAADDPERVMPMVLSQYLPMGLRGLVVAGLLAAFMSTFSATVNAAASYIVRDFWQPLVGKSSDERGMVVAGYVATVSVVAVGTAMGLAASSIREIWDWIMLSLGAAFIIPNVLRWYWWRLNGWGYAWGTLTGLGAALAAPFVPAMGPLYVAFPVICALSLAGCLIGTWATEPTDPAVLRAFFRKVRPFGLWGPIRRESGLSARQLNDPAESMTRQLGNTLVASVAVVSAYLAPMYLVGHWHGRALASAATFVVAAVVLYYTWFQYLPEENEQTLPADDNAGA